MKKISKRLLSVLLIIAMIVPTGALMVNTSAADVSIPADAVEFNGHYYKVFEDGKTWEQARVYCDELGGHLVTITSQAENDFIFSLIDDSKSLKYSIGFTDKDNEGTWEWITNEPVNYANWGSLQPDNATKYDNGDGQDYATIVTKDDIGSSDCFAGEWDDVADIINGPTQDYLKSFICEWEPNIYNMGEETYSFKNFGDEHSANGHCFGMSMTSSGYYLGLLNKKFGVNNDKDLYELKDTAAVKEPICTYHVIQGSIRDQSMVAGGTNYRNEEEYDIATDWNEVVSYVRNHDYDNKGSLQIGYRKSGEGGHAVNFLRFEVVDGQQRIYAYDNNCPTKETYFYQDENGNVLQAVYSTFSGAIDCITLRSVHSYFFTVSANNNMERYKRIAVYANDGIRIDNAKRFLMDGDIGQGEHYVYEVNEDVTTVKITPLADNASFTYLGQEYTFDEINDNTYAELTLSVNDETIPEFEIFNAPADEPAEPDVSDTPEDTTKDCSCNCHSNAFMQFIHKILCFIYKLFGMTQYQYCDCGKAHW